MCFSLGTHCGGRRCALPPAPPHPLLFLNRFPLLYLLFLSFCIIKHHRLFGLISSLLISIETCAYVLLSWSCRSYWQYIHWDLCLCASLLVRIAGGGAAPSPLHPPTRFYFKPVPLATYYSFHLCWYPSRPVPMCFFLDLVVLTCNISIESCAYVLLSWYALRAEALRPPPAPPHPLLFLKRFPLLPTIPFFCISIIVYLG